MLTRVCSKMVRWVRRNALYFEVILTANCLVLLWVFLLHPAWLGMQMSVLQLGSFWSWLSPCSVHAELKLLSSPFLAVPSVNQHLCQIPQITDCTAKQNELAIIWQALYQPDLEYSHREGKVVWLLIHVQVRMERFDSSSTLIPEETQYSRICPVLRINKSICS